MIRTVKFSNFYSFKGAQEINFVAQKKKSYDYFQSESGDKITKVAGFIGENASGKTNVMRLFSFLGHFACNSSKEDKPATLNLAYKTFFNNDEKSDFCVEFEIGDLIFFYEFSLQKNIVLKEALSARTTMEDSKSDYIFLREHDEIKFLSEDNFKDFPVKFIKNIRSDMSLLAFLKSHFKIGIVDTVYNYFAGFKTNINEKGGLNNPLLQLKIIQMYLKYKSLQEDAEKIIRAFNIGLAGFDIKKETKDNDLHISVQGIHNTSAKNNKLDFDYESQGTRSLFFTLANILSALRNDNVVIIDEIETGLHPEALNKLIEYFINENSDRKAQLIFSSHLLGFMNKLDMHQINLVAKNENCESYSYRLNQVDNIRSDENFLAKYMAGAYGAFPKIRI